MICRLAALVALLISIVVVVGIGGAPATAASQSQERQLRVDGLSRRYVAWLPDGYQQKQPLPVLLAFHPALGTADGFAFQTQLHAKPQSANVIVVYPDGYRGSWNLVVCCGEAKNRNLDDVKFVRTILSDLESFVRIDRQRIYATGFSNGSLFTYYLACQMPDEIAAIAPVGGAMQVGTMSSCRRQRPLATFHIHGLADIWAPMNGGEPVLKGAGFQPPAQQGVDFMRRLNGTQRENHDQLFRYGTDCTRYMGGRENTEVIFCKVPDLGHQWPGNRMTGLAAQRAARFGPPGPPILASEAILAFLSQYSIR